MSAGYGPGIIEADVAEVPALIAAATPIESNALSTTCVAQRSVGSCSSRQEVVDGDLADDHAVNHERDMLT